MKSLNHLARTLLVVVSIVLVGASSMVYAAPENQFSAPALEDFWCTISSGTSTCTATKNDTSNFRLQGNFGTPYSVGVIRFNVDAVPWSIAKARLSIAYGYAGSCQAQAVNVLLYETSNNDADPPSRGDFLVTVQNGVAQVPNPDPNVVSEAYQHWTDDTAGDGLAGYLSAEQTMNGGDGIATLWFEAPITTGNIFFATSNGGLSCFTAGSYTLPAPVLQLADASQPLTITLTDTSAQQTNSLPLYAGLGALALVAVAGVGLSRRRMAAR